MKKLLLGAMAIVAAFSLVACGEKEEVQPVEGPIEEVTTVEEVTPVEPVVEEEQVGVGNTDEAMLQLALEKYFKENDPDVEEVIINVAKIYTEDEVEANEAIKAHDLKEGDFAFDVYYELKINDEVPSGELLKYTAAAGEVEGHRIVNRYNLGIARNNGDAGYSIDAFGTGW